MIYYRML